MPRENIAQLVDPGSFKEYWPLVVARQHQRNSIEALRKNTPGDGVVAGTCSINGALFDETRSRATVVHYDYTVLAGTQGHRNHYKQDRMFELASRFRLPLVLFGEGGGGRPGEDYIGPRVAIDTPHIHDILAAERARAADRGRQRAHLRRQYRAGGMQRRDHRHRGINAGHGRSGNDRGRRPRHLHARGSRADVGPGAQRRRRYPGEGRGRRGRCRKEISVLFPGTDRDRGRHPTSGACGMSCRKTGCGCTTCATIIETIADTGSVLEIREKFGDRPDHRVHPGRGPADGCCREQSASSGRCGRLERRRQGCAVPPVVRCVRHPGAQPDRLSGDHGRAGGGADGAGAALHAAVQRGRQHDRAVVQRGGPQGVRPGRAGDVRRGHAWSGSSPSPGPRRSSPA